MKDDDDRHIYHWLQILLYRFYELDHFDLPSEPLSPDELNAFCERYPEDKRIKVIAALEWAEVHPEFPFTTLCIGECKFTDHELYSYLVNMLKQFRKKMSECPPLSDDLLSWQKYPGNPLVRNNRSSGILVPDSAGYRLYTMHDRVDVYFP